jgi:hypothetical protein
MALRAMRYSQTKNFDRFGMGLADADFSPRPGGMMLPFVET